MDNLSTDMVDTSQMTPIEIALQVNEDGMVSAKRLYEFLELDASNYTRWCKDNIAHNQTLEQYRDYNVFVIKDENPQGGRPTMDYLITTDVAKSLAIASRTDKGKEVRQYFLKAEKAAIVTAKECKQLVAQMNVAMQLIQELKTEVPMLSSRIDCVQGDIADVKAGKANRDADMARAKADLVDELEKYGRRWRKADGSLMNVEEVIDEILKQIYRETGLKFTDVLLQYKSRTHRENPEKLDVILADTGYFYTFRRIFYGWVAELKDQTGLTDEELGFSINDESDAVGLQIYGGDEFIKS